MVVTFFFFLHFSLDICIKMYKQCTVWSTRMLWHVCVNQKWSTMKHAVCDFYMSPDCLQAPFRFEKSSKLLLGSWLATIINLRQVTESSEWHANPSWCPSGATVLHCRRKWSHAAPNTVSSSLLGLKLISAESREALVCSFYCSSSDTQGLTSEMDMWGDRLTLPAWHWPTWFIMTG